MILWFFMPVSETMYCGNDLKCKIETTFAPDVKFTKNIQISANSALELTKAYRRRGSFHHKYHLKIQNNKKISPFIYYFYDFSDSQDFDADDVLKQENKRFENYKKYPQIGYNISSLAQKGNFDLYSIIWSVFMGALLVWYIFDKQKNRCN